MDDLLWFDGSCGFLVNLALVGSLAVFGDRVGTGDGRDVKAETKERPSGSTMVDRDELIAYSSRSLGLAARRLDRRDDKG